MGKWKEEQITQSQSAEVTILMQKKLDLLESSSCAGPGRWKPYIFTIPEYFRKDNKDIYRPFSISIGPVYYKDSTLETMQETKWICLNLFLQHPKNAYPNNLEHYVEFIREREVKIRMCYEEILLRRNPISSEDFIQMILLDATFIISLFLADIGGFEKPTLPDNLTPLLDCVTRDIYLMENQLPFFILYELFDTSFGSAFNKSFIEIAWFFLYGNFLFRSKDSKIYPIQRDDPTSIKHLLDLYHIRCLHGLDFYRKEIKDKDLNASNKTYLSLKELQAAGVKIVAIERPQVLHIEYKNGVLKIPKIIIDDETESQLRNMLYFEQCHSDRRAYFIAAYVTFLDRLINSAEDVQVLIKNGVLTDNGLGSNEAVANMFNNLTKYISIDEDTSYYYGDISRGLNAYASKRWHKWKVVLKMQYFNYPWSIISVVAAGILFILTLLQTIAAFK